MSTICCVVETKCSVMYGNADIVMLCVNVIVVLRYTVCDVATLSRKACP